MRTLHPLNDHDRRRLARLRTMQRLALALLGAMAVLFVVAATRRADHAAWGYAAAFGEAAMVGALADWFAVVALFRHPLGLPIWHTAIVPGRKDDIARNLGDFVASHFVTVDAVVGRIRAFDPAARAASWLAEPAHAGDAGRWAAVALRQGLAGIDDTPLRETVRARALAALEGIDPLPFANRWAAALVAEGRHQQALDWTLRRAIGWLESDAAQPSIAQVLDSVDHLLISTLSGRIAAIVRTGTLRLCRAALDDPSHVLRQRFEGWVMQGLDHMAHDAAWAGQVRAWQRELVRDPRVVERIDAWWDGLRQALMDDLAQDRPRVGAQLAEALAATGRSLAGHAAARDWLNRALCDAATPLVARHRGTVAAFIRAQIDAWSKDEMTDRIELAIGRDLQFIRLNGTVVGGAVGVLLHAVAQRLG